VSNEQFYKLYGLLVKSVYSFPESLPSEKGRYDVEILSGHIPEELKNQVGSSGILHSAKNTSVVRIEDVAYYYVEEGKRITVDEIGENPNDIEAVIRLDLLGIVFNLLLSQRSSLLIHGCCLGLGGKCFIVAGETGAGKSTLAATFLKNPDFSLLAEDTCLISFSPQNFPVVQPTLPRIKLLPDAL